MTKIIISGCNGKMGQAVSEICTQDEKIQIVAGFDINTAKRGNYPVYADPMEFSGDADAVIDFSSPSTLASLLKYCEIKKLPVVLCTTGYNDEDMELIRSSSEKIPLFKSANMSLGVNLVAALVKHAVLFLGSNYDIEIVERHHKTKLDAPSGTALMLADAANAALPYDAEYVYERQSVRSKRGKHEIGISAVRGGTIVGEHEVIFAGLDEVIEIKHTAYSRNVFASGAVSAAKYIAGVSEPGIYTMDNMLTKQ